MLTGADEQQLAEWFAAPTLGVQIDSEALDGPEIALVHEMDGLDGDRLTTTTGRPEARIIERSIWPPLRRWAAAHLVAQNPTRWRSLLETATALPSRDAAALAAGAMDAATHIPLAERASAVAAGLASGSGIVRLAALPAIAALEGTDQALARAAADPSAKVRAWTPTLSVLSIEDAGPATLPGKTVDLSRSDARVQGSLF